jgi:TRAP transporter 4TM/12TM fusion protein
MRIEASAPDHGLPEVSEHGITRRLGGWALALFSTLALAFSTYQLVVAAFHPFSSLVTRALHVGFLLALTFLLYPSFKSGAKLTKLGAGDTALALGAFALSTYQWIFEGALVQRAGEPTVADLWVGTAMIILVFEAARRIMGLALPLVCGAFLLYGLFGQYLPGGLAHRGFDFAQIVDQLAFGTEGIFGIPTLVSATYIFLFILFGSFLEHAGMIHLFNSIALGFVGHTKGGAAKVSVLSSGLMGTISGSGVANVLTTGQFTIPLMKRFGYSGVFAGAVEATSSMGGQIMPPVMGAVAFIMAETINVPYVAIVKAALIPAILYFVTAFWMVHLEAGRRGLHGLPKDQCPDPWVAVRQRWHLLLPLIGLVALLFSGYTPLFSGTVGLALTVVLIFGAAVLTGVRQFALRGLFWVLLGLACAGFFQFGVGTFFVVIAVLVVLTYLRHVGADARQLALSAMADGARHALPVAIACALVGVIIGIINLTGVAAELGGHIIAVGENNLFLALLLTMAICLVLGMGIPTIPNYIITSSLAAPVLLKLGVPLIVSHMFVFYFGIMADLTPPVALAAFAAAPIAGATGLAIGMQALRVAIAGFIVPFMAVYSPALMLQGGDWLAVAWIVFKALVAIAMWGAGAIGYLFGPLRIGERAVAIAAASLLVVAYPLTDEAGLTLIAAFVAWHAWRVRRAAGAGR